DPFSAELKLKYQAECSYKIVDSEAIGIRAALRASNAATPENKACADAVTRRRGNPDCTFAVHRGTGELRQFNLSERSASAHSLSEALIGANWRVSTLEEEQAELDRRAAAQKKISFANEQELRAKELEIAQRALQFVQASASVAPAK